MKRMQEIKRLANEHIIEKISKAKNLFFNDKNKMNKPLITHIKYKRKEKKMRWEGREREITSIKKKKGWISSGY